MPRNNADKLSQVNGDGNDNRSHYSEGVCRHPRGFGDGLRVLSSDDYESLSRYGGAPQVEGSSEKRTTPTGTKLSKRISTAFLTYTTILSAPRDPDSTSRGFNREGGSYDLLMVRFTGINVAELLKPLRPARTMVSVGASACIGCCEYPRLSIKQHLGDGRECTLI